jgi:hypothetical protein
MSASANRFKAAGNVDQRQRAAEDERCDDVAGDENRKLPRTKQRHPAPTALSSMRRQ